MGRGGEGGGKERGGSWWACMEVELRMMQGLGLGLD